MEFNYLTVSGPVGKLARVFAIFLITIVSTTIYGQETNPNLAQFLRDKVASNSLSSQDATYSITSQHTSTATGTTHVYYVQTIDGIPVVGTESSLHLTSTGQVLKSNFAMVSGLSNTVLNGRSAALQPTAAIESVAQKMGYRILSPLTEKRDASLGQNSYLFSTAGMSRVDIPVRLVYHLQPKEGATLAYELSIDDINNMEDWYTFYVDAQSGEIVDKFNLIASCNLSHDHGDHTGFIGPLEYEAPAEETTIATVLTEKSAETALAPNDYNVYAMPVESPNYGGRSIVNSPWTDGSGNASPFGWHDTNGAAGAEFTDTQGNNVDAFYTPTGAQTDGGATLDFNFPINTNNAPSTYIDASITNLFYWNNILHDVMYEYGFDAAAGNFQFNNYGGEPGANDDVTARGQISTTCNATFGTPSDGNSPTMNMYVCNATTQGQDGNLDNGVVAHEFAHGISNRLVGGRLNVNCLNNNEQMGEGWSDFYGYILTIEPGDAGDDARGIGTWLLGQSPSGNGVRQYKYTTNMGVNPHTYADAGSVAIPHGVGSIWSVALWEMTWGLIDEYGFDNDIYNFTGTGADAGNIRAMALVTEGLKLTPCSPGMEQGRDAILAADQALYGGANQCIIWTAFAKRGLGLNANQGSNSVGDEIEDFTGPIPAFTVSADTFCSTEGVQVLDGAASINPGIYSGPGVTDNGDGTFDFDPAAAGIGTHVITFTTTDCDGLTATPTDTIDVTDGNPVVLCQDAILTLDGGGNATLVAADVVGNLTPGSGYVIDQTGTFAPEDISAVDTEVTLGDDAGIGVPVGFTFNFFGSDYSTIYIASNGYLTFTNSGLNVWQNTAMGSAAAPNNAIAVMWDDLTPDAGSTISYATIGTAPNRVLVVNYDNIRHYTGGGTGVQNTFQVKLFEGTGVIEMHGTNITNDGGTRTQGIENSDASESYATPTRNNTGWSATNDFVSFTPNAGDLAENCGNSVSISFSQTAFTCADLGDNIVTVTADDGNGGITTCDVTVTVQGTGATFSGGSWDVTPNAGTIATFTDNFNTLADGDVTACACDVDAGATVTVNAGGTLNIVGNINVDGTLDVEHEGSVVQTNDNAVVNNNGSIIVRKTTPSLDNRDFMIVGNPMSGSTRANTFGTAIQFREHITSSFAPNGDVATDDPGVENWADDNGDNWVNYTGTINPGEGYLIIPQGSPTVPDNATYNFVYDDGTLNNGVFTFNAGYNGSQNASANVTANPYPSAIDADAFVADNPLVGTLYFWEHINAPNASYEGYNDANYDMGDISLYVATVGGTAAANGGTAPTGYIASGQGFGFKATSAGTVTYENDQRVAGFNTDYKSFDASKVSVWLNVYNETYKLGSQMLVAFMDGADNDYDPQLDAKRLATPVSLFSTVSTGEQLTIQSRAAFDIEDEIIVGFRSQVDENQFYTISLNDIELGTLTTDVQVYLEDTVTGAITNLSERSYSFASDAGMDEDRFIMFFQEKVLGADDNELNTLSVVPNPTNGRLNVVSPQAAIESVEVRDIRGRLITTKSFNAVNTAELDLTALETAIYFVKIYTAEGAIVKRVIKQ